MRPIGGEEVFENLDIHLSRLAAAVKRLDFSSEVYLFGSVAEGRHLYSSDIDALVVSDVSSRLRRLQPCWAEDFGDTFVVDRAVKVRSAGGVIV